MNTYESIVVTSNNQTETIYVSANDRTEATQICQSLGSKVVCVNRCDSGPDARIITRPIAISCLKTATTKVLETAIHFDVDSDVYKMIIDAYKILTEVEDLVCAWKT